MSWSPDEPYNELPPLPPQTELETVPVLKAVIKARAAVAGLNEALVSLPNPDVFLSSLSILEAQASSEIENIVTTTDELFKAATMSAGATSATREALRYRTALYEGYAMMQKTHHLLTINTATSICSAIRGVDTGIRRHEGTYIGNPETQRRIYTPPQGYDVIQAKLKNWEEFVNTPTDLDPLIKLALAHYQFEAIHPFDDGNGRTGRILNVLLLVSEGLLSEPVLYISQQIIAQKNDYYRLLNAVTEHQAWEEWILYMVEAVGATARSTLEKIKQIQKLQVEVSETVGSQAPAGLVDVLFAQPYCRIKDVVEQCSITRPTATKYLQELVDGGVLDQQKVGRENLYVHRKLMAILQKM